MSEQLFKRKSHKDNHSVHYCFRMKIRLGGYAHGIVTKLYTEFCQGMLGMKGSGDCTSLGEKRSRRW